MSASGISWTKGYSILLAGILLFGFYWLSEDRGIAISAMAASIAAFGLILNHQSLLENTKSREVQLVSETFDRLQGTANELYTHYKQMGETEKKNWDSRLFNDVEYLCFLINRGYIRDKGLAGYFDDAIVQWYEEIFLKHTNQETQRDDKKFKEFKLRYHTIKKEAL